MIDVKATIFKAINTSFNKLRLLGNNNPKLFKKILFLIALDDIYDWSDYLDENQSVQKRLQELRTNFILCNPELEICRLPFDQHYVNVNTPQTNYTWKRVWDAPDVIFIDSAEEIIDPHAGEWTPDPTCKITIVYFGENDEIKADPITGQPVVNLDNLTVCEKMNLYINRETGTLWYLDTNGSWQQIQDQGMTPETVIELIRTHRGKINRTWNDEDATLDLSIVNDEEEANASVELLTESDLEDIV